MERGHDVTVRSCERKCGHRQVQREDRVRTQQTRPCLCPGLTLPASGTEKRKFCFLSHTMYSSLLVWSTCLSPQNSYIESLTPKLMALGIGAPGILIGHGVNPPISGIRALKKEAQVTSPPLPPLSEKPSARNQETDSHQTPNLLAL